MNYDFVPKYWTYPSCKSNNMTKHHHMCSSDLLHFTLYYMLFVPQTSNLFLNISYGSVFLKMCYIMWLWCHRNVTHVIKLYRIRKDGGGRGGRAVVEKKKPTSCQNFPFHHPLVPDARNWTRGGEELKKNVTTNVSQWDCSRFQSSQSPNLAILVILTRGCQDWNAEQKAGR